MRPVVIQVLVLLALAGLAGGLTALLHPRAPAWTAAEARQREQQQREQDPLAVDLAAVRSWGDQVIWIDARSAEEFAQGHIPGAIRLNESQWAALEPAVVERWTPDVKLVVYCSSTGCNASKAIARQLRQQMQWDNVYWLAGGYEAWQEAQR